MQLNHIIFDWAGTLYDDHKPSFLTTRRVIRELSGQTVTMNDYKNHFCLPVIPFYRRFGVELGIDEINEYFFKRYEKNYKKGRLFPSVVTGLKKLHKNEIGTSLFSTMDQKLLKNLCDLLKIKKYFSFIQGSVCDKRIDLKGHLKTIACKPGDVLFVGDTDHDVEAANAEGVPSGCVLNGYHSREKLLSAKPEFVWKNQKTMFACILSVLLAHRRVHRSLGEGGSLVAGGSIKSNKDKL